MTDVRHHYIYASDNDDSIEWKFWIRAAGAAWKGAMGQADVDALYDLFLGNWEAAAAVTFLQTPPKPTWLQVATKLAGWTAAIVLLGIVLTELLLIAAGVIL